MERVAIGNPDREMRDVWLNNTPQRDLLLILLGDHELETVFEVRACFAVVNVTSLCMYSVPVLLDYGWVSIG